MLVRVRLRFQSTPLLYAQKCWFTFDTEQCRLVGDVTHLIASHFGFDQHNVNGIQLFMEDFLVPTNETANVFRDNDLIEVRAVRLSNGRADSSSSSSESSSSLAVQPPARKRVKANKQLITPRSQPTPTPAVESLLNEPQSPPPAAPSAKTLRVSEKKTKSGGIHLTFISSNSSESETSSSEDRPSQLPTIKPHTPNGTTQKKIGEKTVLEDPSPRTKSAKRGGRGKGRGGRQRGRTLPSSLVIGGPSDIHTTLSTVYTNKSSPAVPANKSVITAELEESAPPGSGWDVRPCGDAPVVSEPSRDYSICPNLDGTPRIGDNLAFKLLELSGSCTPEVSQYKLASVMAYDNTSRRVTVKYKNPACSAADSATSRLAQFALEQDAVIGEECPQVELELGSLIEPKLVT